MLDPAIEGFFAERKEAWLKKQLNATMSEQQKLEKECECQEVFALHNWLPNAAKRAGQISISTHPCTFSHPSARKNKNDYATSVIASAEQRVDGFVRTGNVDVEPDALGNAAALDVYKFLTLAMADEQSVLAHIEKETELAKTLLKQKNTNYPELRTGFLKMAEADDNAVTSSKIKQVYFPLGDGEYHQLSLLTHSGLLFDLRKRLDDIRFSEATKEAREYKRNNKFLDRSFSEIYGLTTMGYGGTKPQNISVLNNQNAGKAHLLLSVPPALTPRNIRNPKSDFFKEVLNPWAVKETFDAFQRILKTDYNNKKIREGRDYRIQEYIDYVLQQQWQLRLFYQQGLGECTDALPLYQKVWLFADCQQQREDTDDWLVPLTRDIARCFIRHYQKVIGDKDAYKLSDTVLEAVENIVSRNKEALR